MKREDKTMDLKGRHFVTLKDFTPEEIIYLLDLAAELKEKKKKGILVDHHRGWISCSSGVASLSSNSISFKVRIAATLFLNFVFRCV